MCTTTVQCEARRKLSAVFISSSVDLLVNVRFTQMIILPDTELLQLLPTISAARGWITMFEYFFCLLIIRKPLPKIDSSTPGVNELDLKIQETRMMEKVL